ncbi:conserved hypothetical protein [Ricinus communis]|uniref:Uncharacterized protein n=1 Tax=Ricinus communis TaxID=3988 RepID=B9STM9_RICCO|nr:conserved hypothetical protein [Ricinus communis]
MACGFLSIITELENGYDHPMVLEGTRHLGMFPMVRITVPPGEVKDICYGNLCIEENPDRPILVSIFLDGAAEEEKKKYILSTLIRDNAKLVLNYENSNVTCMPVEGNIMARIGCIVNLKRFMTGIWEKLNNH